VETAKLFRNGQSQAVRIPKEFSFEGAEVFIKKIGNAILLIPYRESWQTLFDSLNQFSDDFMETRNQPEQQVRESPFARNTFGSRGDSVGMRV
jgi:antitoxin VapB